MGDERQSLRDEGPGGKYFHQMLNMYDDDLDAWEYRLLGHYKRVCGESGACWESTRTTAEKCRISVGKVSSTRRSLEAKGFIRVHERGADETLIVTVIDKWAENIARYSSSGEHVHLMNTDVQDVNASVHPLNQRITKEEKPNEEEPQAAAAGEIFRLYEGLGLLISPMVAEHLKGMAQEWPIEWLREAFAEAARHNGKSLAYVQKILERWKRDGKAGTNGQSESTATKDYTGGKYGAFINMGFED